MKNAFYFIYKPLFVLKIFNFFISIFPSFVPVNHCFRESLKINPKVYDVINCLNRQLVPAKFIYVLVCMHYFLAVKYKHTLQGKSFSA